ncbi:hypothetical protein SASPL_118884 [Salvia splendens]|uniref:Rhamnogalacturonase A/B/Epimerase-like pectate lyase domain-containing protein n=1 Tax=Salvia splendens TaxID=180675 RepID=A0A8X8XXK8_SALSN|nr:hypothetical protein SASPL_118884 [Salvia splendens]
MKMLGILLLLVLSSNAAEYEGECKSGWPLVPRPHSVSVLEFGAVGDGITDNTLAFQNAIFYLKSFADKGGAQLYVPEGHWLIGCINLTSHLTIFLEKDAVILGSQVDIFMCKIFTNVQFELWESSSFHTHCTLTLQDYSHWDVVESLPSYGQGLEVPGQRYRSLISGQNLTDVVITGNNGTIDGQGMLPLSVSECSNVLVQNITIYSPSYSPYTSGIVPDSSEHVCIENSNISVGHDAVVLKSGWDEYGMAYGKPTTNVHVRNVRLQSFAGSGVAFGSEMSGGISSILVEHIHVHDSQVGIELKTAVGRGGYMTDISISDTVMDNVQQGIKATGHCNSHPDNKFDPQALPVVSDIRFKNILGSNITSAGKFFGIDRSPFTSICLSNVSFYLNSDPTTSWKCLNVLGSSFDVSPMPCPELLSSASSSFLDCFVFPHPSSRVAYL